ncbi:MAG: N-glycosylase/DNA lyase [Candidatus Njordarchaeales archaeon]
MASSATLFEFSLDYETQNKVACHIKELELNEKINKYVERLPEIISCKELKERDYDEEEILKYIFYVALNNWKLTGVYYQSFKGAEALWRVVKDVVINLEKFDTVEVTQEVLKKLQGLSNERKKLFSWCVQVLANHELNKYVQEAICTKTIDIEKLEEALNIAKGTRQLPVKKIVNLIARTCNFALDYKINGNPSILYDVHVAKVTLRLGLIRIKPRKSARYFGVAFPLFGNNILENLVKKTWDEISKRSKVHVWKIDAMIWFIGRENCLFDDDSRLFQKRKNNVSCPLRAIAEEEIDCPLQEVCESNKKDLGIRILTKKQTGYKEIAILLHNLYPHSRA